MTRIVFASPSTQIVSDTILAQSQFSARHRGGIFGLDLPLAMQFCLPARCGLCRFGLDVGDEIVIGVAP